MNWKKYFAEQDERKRWNMLMAENRISYDHIDTWLLDLRRWMIEDIMNWCYKNNTIPMKELFKDLPETDLRLCSTDGGWCNCLKLKKFLEEGK